MFTAEINTPYLHVAILSILYLITWLPSIKGGWVSDDLEGIAKFSDRYHAPKHELVDYYDLEIAGKKTQFKNTAFNPHIGFPETFIRWFRINMGKKHTTIGKNAKGHDVYGWVQDPFRHHIFSLILQYANIILAYIFLSEVFGPTLAIMAVGLFIVHPVCCQTVAWISGIGYLLCLFGALLTFNAALFLPSHVSMYVVIFTSLISAYGLFPGNFNFVILLMLWFWPQAIISLLACSFNGYRQSRKILGVRIKEFKKQNMGQSTFLNWNKPIVMLKTLWYYTHFIIFPKRLGLFHKWGYHYDSKIERFDRLAFGGLLVLGCLIYFAWFGVSIVQFAVLWFAVYLITFSNFITAMQFVADRYIFIPALGYCLLVSYLLQDHMWLYFMLAGMGMMRIWVHMPTFKNEVDFYTSNCFNFPNSEVAYGNLGVAYMHSGRPGTAVDTWLHATKIDDSYDVPHYNLYSIFRSNGNLDMAKKHLDDCLKAKVVHFPDVWTKERGSLEAQIYYKRPLTDHIKEVNKAMEVFNERK